MALLAGMLLASPVSAQDGWLGLQLEFEDSTGPNGEDRQTVIVIGVAEDSPADRAGIQENDVVLEIDGDIASEDVLEAFVRAVDPGDAVDVVILRGEDRIPLVVEAGERPDPGRRAQVIVRPSRDGDRIELRLRLDSIRSMVEAVNRERLDRVNIRMDSLRTQLERGALDTQELERALERASVARGEALEELMDQLSILQDSLGGVEILQGRALRDLTTEEWNAAVRGVIPQFDVVIPDFSREWDPAVIAWGSTSPIMIGQRVVAGAELVELNESLARYFDVDGGALVVDVSERSLAGEAGVQPGDVIVEVDGEAVRGVADVRERFARLTFAPRFRQNPDADEAVTLTVVRDSRRMEIELRE